MRIASLRSTQSAKTILFYALLVLPLLSLAAQAGGDAKPQGAMSGPAAMAAPSGQNMLEGTIVSIEGPILVIAGSGGESSRVDIQSDTVVLKREAASLDSIKPGEALGVAAIKGDDGSLTATAINVFSPEVWKVVRKGQWPMASGQIMTNAEVEKVGDRVEGRTLYLKYEMLDAAIAVPMSADIKRLVTLDRSELQVGMKVSLRLAPTDDGSLRAAMITLVSSSG